MSSFEDEMKEALEEFRKVCINKTPGPGFQLTAAAITAAHERDGEA